MSCQIITWDEIPDRFQVGSGESGLCFLSVWARRPGQNFQRWRLILEAVCVYSAAQAQVPFVENVDSASSGVFTGCTDRYRYTLDVYCDTKATPSERNKLGSLCAGGPAGFQIEDISGAQPFIFRIGADESIGKTNTIFT